MPRTPRRHVLLLLLLVIATGIILRKAPLGLPYFITKWGGSWLWGAMIWCIVTLLSRQRHPLRTAAIATVVAFATECLKLLHMPALDSFRSGSFGGFLLGHHFAFIDLGLYAFAIATMTFLSLRWDATGK